LEKLGQQNHRWVECHDLPEEPPGPIAIPHELEDGFSEYAQGLFPNLSAIPLDRGVDAAAFFFHRVTKTTDQLVQSGIKYLIAIINIMMAVWLIRMVKTGEYYRNATRYSSPNTVEQLMNRSGMTIERFFNKFEEVISSSIKSHSDEFFLTYSRICMNRSEIFSALIYYSHLHLTCLKYSRRKD
jgi:hypothetical protein